MTKTQIETLLSKIRTKISNAETTYFYSQRKTISLFEALKQYAISGFETKDFFNICNQLPYERLKNGNLKFYQDEEWFDCAPWGEEIPCSKSTIRLINAINKSNNTKFQKDEDEKIYTKVLKLKTSEEMKDCLLQIFLEEHPSKEYWHELGKLIGFVLENENFIEALKLLQKENMPLEVKVKAKHFSDMYDEQYFHYQYNKQMAENYQPNEDEI